MRSCICFKWIHERNSDNNYVNMSNCFVKHIHIKDPLQTYDSLKNYQHKTILDFG